MSVYFPDEILHKILLKLPAKSLLKFTLVSKSWNSLIKSSTFIKSHLHTTTASNDQNDSHLLLLTASSLLKDTLTWDYHHWLHWDSPEFGVRSTVPIPVVSLIKKPVSEMRVVGTCNGLVCLEAGFLTSNRYPTLIWNPSIRKVVELPKPLACFRNTKCHKYSISAFGYDAHSNDYKILRIVTLPDDHSDLSRFETKVQVYSLARGTWRRLRRRAIPVDLQGASAIDSDRPVLVSGAFHTLEKRLSVYYNDNYEEHVKYSDGDLFISTFNLASEEFGEIMRPQALEGSVTLSRFGDSLALVDHHNTHYGDSFNRGCDIWVMKEYGVAESWSKLFNIPVFQASIYGFKRCGEVVLMESTKEGGSRMVSFDPKTNQFEVFGSWGRIYSFMDSFVESLVLLDHAKAISTN